MCSAFSNSLNKPVAVLSWLRVYNIRYRSFLMRWLLSGTWLFWHGHFLSVLCYSSEWSYHCPRSLTRVVIICLSRFATYDVDVQGSSSGRKEVRTRCSTVTDLIWSMNVRA